MTAQRGSLFLRPRNLTASMRGERERERERERESNGGNEEKKSEGENKLLAELKSTA